jgi:DNA-binding transcriptional LysR family regulator
VSFSNVNYNLYKIFITVYECKNISRAAKELILGQPNVSRSIKELEKQLDVKLFHTSSRGVEPTGEGVELYHKIAPALAWISHGEKNIKEFKRTSTGLIRIAVAANFAWSVLSWRILDFNKEYPNIQFDIIYVRPSDAVIELERRNVDLVVSTLPFGAAKINFEKVPLGRYKTTLFASAAFAKQNALKRVISKEQFDALPKVTYRGSDVCARVVAAVETQETLFQLVMTGLGVGHCSGQFLDCNHPHDPIFRFSVKGMKAEECILGCVYNGGLLTKAAKIFIDSLSKKINSDKSLDCCGNF